MQLDKQCSKCRIIKHLADFAKDKSTKTGFSSQCKECVKVRSRAYNKSNKPWQRESTKQANKERMKLAENKQRANHASTKFFHNNPDKVTPYNRANAAQQRIKQRYPHLLKCTIQECLHIYEKAYLLEKKTRIKHHVDHKIPLIGGGIHHPSNLEILSESEHIKKTQMEGKLVEMLLTEYYRNNK